MLAWAHTRGVQLFLIEPSKPKQNTYIESFNSRLRDEWLNEQWFTSLQHAEVIVETRGKGYNEERPKKSQAPWGGPKIRSLDETGKR